MDLDPLFKVNYTIEGENSVEIYDFSNEDVHKSGIPSIDFRKFINDSPERKAISFILVIYANGSSHENKGYVSALIEIVDLPAFLSILPFLDFSCTISVIDVSGNRRFSQSLSISPFSYLKNGQQNISFGFDKFLKRKTLLSSDQSDLLPKDTLTVYFDWYSPRPIPYNQPVNIIKDLLEIESSFNLKGDGPVNEGKLILSSYLFAILFKESEYFQLMSVTPMTEMLSDLSEIGEEELFYLKCIALMSVKKCFLPLTISDLCGIYETAHRCRIQFALDKIREFMKSSLSHDNFPEIKDIAGTYDDSYLKEAVESFPQPENEGETDGGSESFNLFRDEERLSEARYVLYFDYQYNEIHEHQNERSDFDFYK